MDIEIQKHVIGVARNALMSIGIYLDARDIRRWNMAVKRITRLAEYWILNEMQRRSATDFSHLIIRNIMNQTYASGYQEYNQRYREWLVARGYDLRFWLLRYDLVRNIQIFYFPNKTNSKGRDVMAGIPSGIMDSGGKSWWGTGARRHGNPKSIAMYAHILEFGKRPGPGGAHPARPIFQPTMQEYADAGWLTRGQEALNKISMGWQ